jgi:hypothetical protein
LTVRDWLATTPFYDKLTAADYFSIDDDDLTERQLEVLEEARRRGFLFDPTPVEPQDYWGGYGFRHRCWPEMFSDGRHSGFFSVQDGYKTPCHFAIWDEFCSRVLDRPSVTAGRFFPEDWGEGRFRDTLGVRVHDRRARQDYRPARRGWGGLVRMAADAAVGSFPLASWVFFDGRTLAVLVAAEKAELLAAHLHDRMVDDLGVPEPDFERS